ncbi:dTMP kinase [Tissierella sp. Yu-01]|uniref:dTMP kinase n=1 Tax=Tissierella sp. Yu-01 TaxID=3035694 RepID=UPI00240E4D12|nr:dTMP kinase [Tissierella sp. Yu-01]WFA08484.1 dTMP kinase [Tissierella sp. Yu-01]
MKGKFITLEGPDGSGKSTIIELISDYMNKKGIEFIVTREPGGTPIGEEIRAIILDNANVNMGAETEALLYAAARSQHIHEKILPALNEGKIVFSDRFVLSSLAYQGVGRGLGIEKVKSINDFGLRDVYPDLILFFDIDPELTLKRKTISMGGDRLEQEGNEFHRRVYDGYMELIKKYPQNVKKIDANKSVEEVLNQSIVEIEKILF